MVKFTTKKKQSSSAPSASDDVLHSLSKKGLNPTLVSHSALLCVISSEVLCAAAAAAAAAVVADLPRVRGETETIVGLGLN